MKKNIIRTLPALIASVCIMTSCGANAGNGKISETPDTHSEKNAASEAANGTTEKPADINTPVPPETEQPVKPTINQIDFSSVNNSGTGWGFKKTKGSEPEIYQKTKDMLAKYDAYYMDQTKPKALYLTFDEGYENGYTGAILDTLKKCDVKAAFFITGGYLKTEKELIRRMIDEGHIVGNHTVNHPNLHKLSDPVKISAELSELNRAVEEEFGYTMRYMRPPEGEYSERVLAVAQSSGFKTILWSFAYMDWDPQKQSGAAYAVEQVTPYFHDGEIILLHAVSSDNAAALETIINNAKAQGYQFRSLDELKPADGSVSE
ncbi:MAG: polysaccharide deacetylase family protein [Oscillospiraceae bacterium]|nr:polysaccharide deacetylase family protein [Oscillospiraceae bacterium]